MEQNTEEGKEMESAAIPPSLELPFYSILSSCQKMKCVVVPVGLSLSLSRARRPSSVNDGMESDQVEKEKIGGKLVMCSCLSVCLFSLG